MTKVEEAIDMAHVNTKILLMAAASVTALASAERYGAAVIDHPGVLQSPPTDQAASPTAQAADQDGSVRNGDETSADTQTDGGDIVVTGIRAAQQRCGQPEARCGVGHRLDLGRGHRQAAGRYDLGLFAAHPRRSDPS